MHTLRYYFLICLFFLSSLGHAEEMSDESVYSLRLYGHSAHLESPARTRDQRYGLSVMGTSALPFDMGGMERNTSIVLLLNMSPDVEKKSADVNILEHFYSLNALLRFDYVYLFRFSVLAGPGLLLGQSDYNVLGHVSSHKTWSYAFMGGLGLDYAINRQWEISYLLSAQYRLAYEKLDWYNALGVAYNF